MATLSFRLSDEVAQTDDVLVYLDLAKPLEPVDLTVKIGQKILLRTRSVESQQLRLLVPSPVVKSSANRDGAYVVSLTVDHLVPVSRYNHGDGRTVGVGVKSFMLIERSDTASRLKMVELCISSQAGPALTRVAGFRN